MVLSSGWPGCLRAAGHEVYTPTMTGPRRTRRIWSGPDVDLDLHIRDIVAVLHFEDLRDVILVGHSYGGMVITGVADRAADRVGRLVYLDAANPVNGQSLVDVAGPVIGSRASIRPGASTASSWCCFRRPTPACSTASPTPRTWHGWPTGSPAIRGGASNSHWSSTDEAALWAIPQYHIVCTLDPGDPRRRTSWPTARAARPPVGHRHRPRPDDHRARRGHRRPDEGRGVLTTD